MERPEKVAGPSEHLAELGRRRAGQAAGVASAGEGHSVRSDRVFGSGPLRPDPPSAAARRPRHLHERPPGALHGRGGRHVYRGRQGEVWARLPQQGRNQGRDAGQSHPRLEQSRRRPRGGEKRPGVHPWGRHP